jgi:hypothetical protein
LSPLKLSDILINEIILYYFKTTSSRLISIENPTIIAEYHYKNKHREKMT